MNYGLQSGDTTMMAVGAVFSLFSSGVKTKADIRQWDGLPDVIRVGTMKGTGTGWTATPVFMANGAPMAAPMVASSYAPVAAPPPPRASGGMGMGMFGMLSVPKPRPTAPVAAPTPAPNTQVAAANTAWPMMRGDPKGCSVVWARSQHLALTPDIVGEDPGVQAAVSRKADVQKKDKAFRVSLDG